MLTLLQDDVLLPIDRRQLQQLGSYKQPVQTNQIAFSNSGKELFLTTGDGQLKILDYPSMVCATHILILHGANRSRKPFIPSTPTPLPAIL
jgi:THO complex subunit 3